MTTYDHFSEYEFDQVLLRELNKRTKLATPPSQQIQAWRDYERQKFGFLGRNAPPHNMGYNLGTDAADLVHSAHAILTDPLQKRRLGITAKTVPRRAVAILAQSIGYRYMRGLEAITHKLKGERATEFHAERQRFRHEFETAADAAHAENDKGQSPNAVLALVHLYIRELVALCSWLEDVGKTDEADRLREACILPK
jgi:hypothetical protein